MATLLLTIVFLLSCGCRTIYGQKTCDDCTPFTDCPEAVNFMSANKSAESREIVKNSFCGLKYGRGPKIVKVCCSDFKNIQTGTPTKASIKDSIESHRNVDLLPKLCGEIHNQRLLYTRAVAMNELPYIAQIFFNTSNGPQFFCGGSIINSRYIMTAAHCMKENQVVGVRIGEIDLRYQNDCHSDLNCESHLQDIAIEETITHEGYVYIPVQNDIALLRLKKEIDFSYKNVAPVCLPIAKELRKPLKEGERGLVAGWGMTGMYAESPILLKDTIPILNNDNCSDLYMSNRRRGQEDKLGAFCSGDLHENSCSGDSGGPFVMERSYGDHITRYVQYGILSRDRKIYDSNYPGIYTNVMDYMDWILNNIKP